MRKGWFRKARIKFIKKRVYRWVVTSYGSNPSIEMSHTGFSTLTYYSKDEQYQILERLQDLGFVKGFLYGRKLDRGKEGWGLRFDNRVA